MKRLALLLAASAVAVSYAHAADDIASVAPEHCKLLKEDAKVRVIHCLLKKGDKVGMHSHPPFVAYFIKGGKSRYTLADGTTRDVETKDDEALILSPVTHSGEQLSGVDEILVELKQRRENTVTPFGEAEDVRARRTHCFRAASPTLGLC